MNKNMLKLPKDVLCDIVASDEEAAIKAEMFFQTPDGVNLQAQLHAGVLDEVAYRQRFNQLFARFLDGLSSGKQAA